ncbi:hypothetical protein [Jannaschia sp. R86511]|uniref:hypothetical protein n=1 Tax=Jannaschia sp. R86511 TaxID=3093853 RepID=UPI0036D410E0
MPTTTARSRTSATTRPAEPATEQPSPWPSIARTVRRTPTPHNTQPLHLHVTGPLEATVLFDRTRALPAHPLGLLFGHVTVGILLESVSIAAHALGHDVEVDLVPGDVRPLPPAPAGPGAVDPADARFQPVAHVRLTPAGPFVPDLDAGLLAVRRTNRLPYDGRDLPVAVLAELAQECAVAGHGFGSTDSRHLVAQVVDLNQRTLFDDLATPPVREELRAWMRYTRRSADTRADGFSARCLHTPGPLLRSVFEHPRLWATRPMQTLSRLVYLRSMHGTPRVAWVRGPMGSTADAVAAGRLLIRLWLRLAAHGVAVHPLGSLVTNATSLAEVDDVVARATGETTPAAGLTWMVLRLGYGPVPPQSRRVPLHDRLHLADAVAGADEGVR